MRFKKCSDRHRLIRRKSQWAIVRDSPLLPIDNAITPTEMTKVGVGSSKPVRSDDIRMDGLVRMVLSVDRPRRMDGIIREDSRNGKIPGLKCLMILSISRVLKSKSNENYGQDEMERGLEEYQRPVDRRGTSPNDKTAAIPLAKNLAPTSQQNDLSKKLTSSNSIEIVSKNDSGKGERTERISEKDLVAGSSQIRLSQFESQLDWNEIDDVTDFLNSEKQGYLND